MSNSTAKTLWNGVKKAWHFIWNDDSLLGWIVNIIVAFILIKFLVYPALGFILSTDYPVVAVVSGSMEHDGNFDDWWGSPAICDNTLCTQEDYYAAINITKEEFRKFHFRNGFNTGDIMVLRGRSPEQLQVGNVIVFMSEKPDPIIHRIIISKQEDGKRHFQTKGDHNPRSILTGPLSEVDTSEDAVIGQALFKIPYLGWIKIGATKLVHLIAG